MDIASPRTPGTRALRWIRKIAEAGHHTFTPRTVQDGVRVQQGQKPLHPTIVQQPVAQLSEVLGPFWPQAQEHYHKGFSPPH